MTDLVATSETARAIQLAVAPVFLLAGIGGFMNVIAGRLARVVDRARRLEVEHDTHQDGDHARQLAELRTLEARMSLATKSISFCTASGLATCVLVILLFVGELIDLDLGDTIALLFVAAIALLATGMMLFLRETRIAVRALHVREDLLAPTRDWR